MKFIDDFHRLFGSPTNYNLKRSFVSAFKFALYQIIRFFIYGFLVSILLGKLLSSDGKATPEYLVLLNIWFAILISWVFSILYRIVISRRSRIPSLITIAFVAAAIYENIVLIKERPDNVAGLVFTIIAILIVSTVLSVFATKEV